MSGAGRGGADVADRPTGAGPESGRDHPRPLTVLGIPGSLRAGSFNRRLLEEARELAPDGMQVRIFGLEDLPLYDADLDTDGARPEPVQALERAIGEADAVLIATPEYNHSIPGVLKNAIDWASRPAGRSPLREKPVAVMGASPGGIGTARAQQHLQSVLLSTLALLLPHPGVAVGRAREKFGEGDEGPLVHEATRGFLRSFLGDLEAWTRRVGATAPARSRAS